MVADLRRREDSTLITIGLRAADTPESRTAEAVKTDRRGVDLTIAIMDGNVDG